MPITVKKLTESTAHATWRTTSARSSGVAVIQNYRWERNTLGRMIDIRARMFVLGFLLNLKGLAAPLGDIVRLSVGCAWHVLHHQLFMAGPASAVIVCPQRRHIYCSTVYIASQHIKLEQELPVPVHDTGIVNAMLTPAGTRVHRRRCGGVPLDQDGIRSVVKIIIW
jgi:hypothetical protein